MLTLSMAGMHGTTPPQHAVHDRLDQHAVTMQQEHIVNGCLSEEILQRILMPIDLHSCMPSSLLTRPRGLCVQEVALGFEHM